MGKHDYQITVPEDLSVIDRKTAGLAKIYFYGNGTSAEDSTVIGMHLVSAQSGASEFVFLTPVPYEWIIEDV